MQVTISIVVGRRPGLLAQVVSVLMREDCKLLRQAVSKADDPALQRFTITVEGPEAAIHDLPRLLRAFGTGETPGTPGTSASGAPPAAAPPPAAVEAAVQDIVAAFPDVAERVQALARSLPAAVRTATLSSLGERLGRREYRRGYALGSPLKLEQALRRMVLPAVRQLAKADLEASALRLPGCPFCAAPPADGRGCDFLVGFARGLLHAAPATADTAVREARCRAAGDPFCELVFAAP
jgi:predicted hydrocarbon binding protein